MPLTQRNDIERFISDKLTKKTGQDVSDFFDVNIFTSGLLDSFEVMDFILSIEEEFNIDIPADLFDDRRLQEFSTLPDVILGLLND